MTEEKEKTETKVSRRSLIKGLAAGAVVGAVGGAALLAQKQVTAAGPAGPAGAAGASLSIPGAAYPIKYTTDVVVVGGGNGGLSAAISAAQEGAKVILLEISQKTGGGSAYSGGLIHDQGCRTWAEYVAYTEGLHDPVLAQTYLATFLNTYIPWLTSIGAYFHQQTGTVAPGSTAGDWLMGKGEPLTEGHRLYFNSLEKAYAGVGGVLLLKTRGLKLLTDKYGNLAGVRASTWVNKPTEQNQFTFDIAANSVILATGSFAANPTLKQQFVAHGADKILVYSVPYARGDGILMAQELGAAMSASMDSFSGGVNALTPALQTEQDPDAFEAASAQSNPNGIDYGTLVSVGRYSPPGWSTDGILVNLDGKRFIDENSPMNKGKRVAQQLALQRQGTGFMIGDKVIHDTVSGSQAALDAITAAGGTVYQANTIQDLANALAASTLFYANNFVTTVTNYNAAIDAKTTIQLDPPRTVLPTTSEKNGGLYKIATPPFYAVAIVPGMYIVMGGLAINTSAEVLDMKKKPIPGLYCTFTCAGGMMNTVYTGGIASAGTFGYIAGKSAAKYAKTGIVPTATTTTTTTT